MFSLRHRERENTSSARPGPDDSGLQVVAHLQRGADDRLPSARVA